MNKQLNDLKAENEKLKEELATVKEMNRAQAVVIDKASHVVFHDKDIKDDLVHAMQEVENALQKVKDLM